MRTHGPLIPRDWFAYDSSGDAQLEHRPSAFEYWTIESFITVVVKNFSVIMVDTSYTISVLLRLVDYDMTKSWWSPAGSRLTDVLLRQHGAEEQ